MLINCSEEKIKADKKDQCCKRAQRGGRVKGFNLLIVIFFSGSPVRCDVAWNEYQYYAAHNSEKAHIL